MVHKNRIYWSLQIGGWLLYATNQSVSYYVASSSISPRRILFFTIEAFFCLIITNWFRVLLNRYRWLYLPMHKLVPSVFLSVFFMGLIIYFSLLPITALLGQLFQPTTTINLSVVFNISQILG